MNLFNRYQERGGEEILVEKIIETLSEEHQVEAVFFDSRHWKKESIALRILQPIRMLWNPQAIKETTEVIKTFEPDVILVHNLFPVGSLGLYRLLVRSPIPVCQFVHNFRPFSINGYCWGDGKILAEGLNGNFLPEIRCGSWQASKLKTLWFGLVLKFGHWFGVWKSIDRWIAVSEFMARSFRQAGLADETVVSLRTYWKPSEGLRHCRENMPKNVLFLGRLAEQKGIHVLLEAWQEVEICHPDARLIIAGEGPLEGPVRDASQRSKSIEYLGFVDRERKFDLLRSTGCLVVPSVWWEPLGMVVYEAYEFAVPVAAAASGGLQEIVHHDHTGLRHQPGNSRELAAHLIELLGDPEKSARLGKAGREWLLEEASEASWKRTLDRVLQESI
ncbi:MAG: glycosyltransferase family 4 protein, partial [Verrucomicrobiota bacterium]